MVTTHLISRMIPPSNLMMGRRLRRPPVIIRWVEFSLTVQCCSRG